MKVKKMYLRCVLLSLIAALLASSSLAQNKKPNEASLRITIVDPAGAAIPNVKVTLSKPTRTQRTDERGTSSFNRLAPGKYQVEVTADGFAPLTLNDYPLRPGDQQIEIKLELAEVQEVLNVEQDKREANLDPRGRAFTTVLTAEQIAQLPDDPEEFEQAIRDMAGPGATFRVNGFRGGKLPPKSQIREIRFRMNPYAAENHDASMIGVDILTKPGLNNWHGSLNAGFRDEALNARNAFAPFRAPEQNRRFGFELSGPLWRKHTSLFLSADGVNSYEAKTILAALPTSTVNDVARQPWRTLNLTSRVEHMLTKTHTLLGEYQRNARRQDNLGVGNYDLPSRAFNTNSTEHLLRLADSGTLGKKLLNEIRFQLRWQSVEQRSLFNDTTIQVLNAFTNGGAQVNSQRRVRDSELADNIDFAFSKHSLRAGLQLETAHYNSNEERNLNGTFLFSCTNQPS